MADSEQLPRLHRDAVYALREPIVEHGHTFTHVQYIGWKPPAGYAHPIPLDSGVVVPDMPHDKGDRRIAFRLLRTTGNGQVEHHALGTLHFTTWWPYRDVARHVKVHRREN